MLLLLLFEKRNSWERVKADGMMLMEKDAFGKIWTGNFQRLLNVKEDAGQRACDCCNGKEELYETLIMRREVKERRTGRVPLLDVCAAQCLKRGGVTVN